MHSVVAGDPEISKPRNETDAGKTIAVKRVGYEFSDAETVVTITADAPFDYLLYKLDNPSRLAVEIAGAKSEAPESAVVVNNHLVSKIYVIYFEKGHTVRVEIGLKRSAIYETRAEGRELELRIRPTPSPELAAARAKLERLKRKAAEQREEILALRGKVAELESRRVEDEEKISELEAAMAGLLIEKERAGGARAGKPAPDRGSEKDAVEKALYGWLDAWRSRDIDRYADYYADSFRSSGKGKNAWIEAKRARFERAGAIAIDMEDINISFDEKGRARVKFIQRYSSDLHGDVGIKNMIMSRTDKGWKIEKETWRPWP